MSIFSSLKGFDGELTGWLSKKLFLDGEIYKDLNNVTINASNGTTQIDQIIVSKFGVFVIEVKNLKGWIFGDEKAAKWTYDLYGKNISSRIRCGRISDTQKPYRIFSV
jgi:restriction system protein